MSILINRVGNLAAHTLEMLGQVIRKVSFNRANKTVRQLCAFPFDIVASLPLIGVRLVAHVIRGIVGTIFHPGAMFRGFSD